jgi:hypothetical protein
VGTAFDCALVSDIKRSSSSESEPCNQCRTHNEVQGIMAWVNTDSKLFLVPQTATTQQPAVVDQQCILN